MCKYVRVSAKENIYILMRRISAMGSCLCFYFCRLFPIKENRISVCTFEGKGGFGCNPKYIVQEIHKRHPDYEIIWFVNDMEKSFPEYVKKVPNTLWSRAFWLSTSKIWIDNYRKPFGTCKRRGQIYINTWHATIGFKTIGRLRGNAFSKMAYLVSNNDSKMIDRITIDSEFCAEIFPQGLVYEGEFIRTGAPRCDILYGDRNTARNAFRKRHHISTEAKIAMYAPTFREGVTNGKRFVFAKTWTLDFEQLIIALERKFGGTWYLCIRVHPQLASDFQEYQHETLQGRILNESQADDMYEIMAAVDIFITDYSSAAFEAAFAHIPVFLYADDVEEYTYDRGALLWNFNSSGRKEILNNREYTRGLNVKLPFSLAKNNQELMSDISDFVMKEYVEAVDCLMRDIDQVFDGEASRRVVDEIEQMCSR